MIRRFLGAFAVLLLVSGAAFAQPVGRFNVEGIMGNDSYRGTIEISPTGDTYEVHWQVEGSEFTGVGLWVNDSFVVGYQGGGDVGVVVYRRGQDGNWEGIWAPAGSQQTGHERILTAGGPGRGQPPRTEPRVEPPARGEPPRQPAPAPAPTPGK